MNDAPLNDDTIYGTETMAELCARQGRVGEAIAIYRRLVDLVAEPSLRDRFARRLNVLEAGWQAPRNAEVIPADLPIPEAPGVAVLAADDQVTVAWSLPPGTVAPALELFVLQRAPAGIEADKQTLALEAPSGRRAFSAPNVHSALAAVGVMTNDRFVPLARSPR